MIGQGKRELARQCEVIRCGSHRVLGQCNQPVTSQRATTRRINIAE
jgi:hypothetical protein